MPSCGGFSSSFSSVMLIRGPPEESLIMDVPKAGGRLSRLTSIFRKTVVLLMRSENSAESKDVSTNLVSSLGVSQ